MKPLKHCTNGFEANIVKGMLENNGIRAVVINQNQPYAGIPFVGDVDVVVDEQDYEKAKKLLAEVEKGSQEIPDNYKDNNLQ